MTQQVGTQRTGSQRGMSILFVAIGLMLLTGIVGLAIDLASLYVARNEAQRAADAAALAGASEFVSSSVTNGLMTVSAVAPLAAAQASQIGNQNLIIGRNPNLLATNFNSSCPPPTGVSGGCFDFSITNDPRITVVVKRDMPTYFMRIFGITAVPISVQATAEAYNPAGGAGPTNSVQCVKPWLLPNCDPNFASSNPDGSCPAGANCACGQLSSGPNKGLWPSYFVDPNNNDAIVHPGLQPTGSIGQLLQIKVGSPADAEAPSQFWPVFLPSNGVFTCPNCASNDVQNSTSNSAALYRENIECCSTQQITCGTTTVDPISGDMTGPTAQGVQCLVHEANNGTGQDCLSLDTSPTCSGAVTSLALPFTMYAGSLNPYGASTGSQISTSDSLVTVPIYDGAPLCPGNSCPTSVSVNVVGFLQVFIRNVGSPQNSVYAYLLNITGCGGGIDQNGGGGAGGVVPVYAGAPIPVRLVHN
jgi:hypothetical protein